MPQYNHLWNYLPHGNDGITLELRQLLASVTPAGDPFNLWDFEYPSYYEGDEKEFFEQKVIAHFYFREIGFETPARFVHHFRQKMREIMPYYIQLYKSAELMDDPDIHPLENYRLNEEHHNAQHSTGSSGATTTAESDSTTGTTGSATTKRSDTPQGSISNLDSYLTEATVQATSGSGTAHDETGTETSTTSEAQATDDGTLTRYGNIGVTTYADLLEGYRKTFRNIDMEIIEELEELFLRVY